MAHEIRDAPCTAIAAAPSPPARPAVGAAPASTGRPNASLRSLLQLDACGRRPAPTRPEWPATGDAAAQVKAATADTWAVVADSTAVQSAGSPGPAQALPAPARTAVARIARRWAALRVRHR